LQLMHAMASCILATTKAYGGSRLEVELEGAVDLHGISGLDPAVRPGLRQLEATVTVAGDADRGNPSRAATRGLRFSPIQDSVERGVEVCSRIEVK
jgi:hypothetical protein